MDATRIEPKNKKAFVYIEMDEVFKTIRSAFGEKFLRVDPQEMANVVIEELWKQNPEWGNLDLHTLKVYSSYLPEEASKVWNNVWVRALRDWTSRLGLNVFAREMKVTKAQVVNDRMNPGDSPFYIAPVYNNNISKYTMICDVIADICNGEADVVVLITKDGSLSPLVQKIKDVSVEDEKWIKVVNAFPYRQSHMPNTYHRGIDGCDWFHITEAMYIKSLLPHHY